jgi:hypothetical protein
LICSSPLLVRGQSYMLGRDDAHLLRSGISLVGVRDIQWYWKRLTVREQYTTAGYVATKGQRNEFNPITAALMT